MTEKKIENSGCLWCGSETEKNIRTGKPKKYCSKKCNQDYLYEQERKQHPRYNDPTWKNQKKNDDKRRQKQKEKYEWYKANWYTTERIEQEFGTSKATTHHRAKTAGINPTIVGYKAPTAFWSPEDAKRIATINEQITPIPKGYLTKPEAAKYLGITKSTLGQYGANANYGHPPSIEWQETHGKKSLRKLYTKKDLDEWKTKIEKLRRENIAETKRRQEENQKQREQHRLQCQKNRQKNREYKKSTRSLIQAQKKLGSTVKRHEQKRLRKESRKYLNNSGSPLVLDAGTDERYEEKLARRIKHIGPSAYTLNNPKSLKNWQANIEIMRLYSEEGIITHLLCKTCKKELPYWKFYVEFNSGVKRLGRRNHCKQCQSVIRKSHTTSALLRGKRKTFPTQFCQAIIQDIGRKTGVLYDIGLPQAWKKIETYLGYTREDLIMHIESQFEPWMNWNNHGRPNKVGVSMWQLDHIKPKANFDYDCIEHPDFIECWGLKNLKPIQARLNILKSNKKLRTSLSNSFVNGVLRRQGPEYTGGIWAEVPYTITDARKNFENQFTPNMNWKNFGTAWQIDHKIPQAALPYTSTLDPNFKKCWELKNLRPLSRSKNSSKGSKYKNIIYWYNDEDK